MNYKKGFFRLWLVFSSIWMVVIFYIYGISVYQDRIDAFTLEVVPPESLKAAASCNYDNVTYVQTYIGELQSLSSFIRSASTEELLNALENAQQGELVDTSSGAIALGSEQPPQPEKDVLFYIEAGKASDAETDSACLASVGWPIYEELSLNLARDRDEAKELFIFALVVGIGVPIIVLASGAVLSWVLKGFLSS